MAIIGFDALKFANRLKAADVSDKRAEAEAGALPEVLEFNLKKLATKDDLTRETALLRRDADNPRADLKRDIAGAKAELICWVVAAGVLQITLIAALLIRCLPGWRT